MGNPLFLHFLLFKMAYSATRPLLLAEDCGYWVSKELPKNKGNFILFSPFLKNTSIISCSGNCTLDEIQRGRKLILDGGTQLNNKNLIFAKISSFSIFYSIKFPKDGGT